MKSTKEGINNKLHITEEWIDNLEDQTIEITQSKKK